MPIGTKALATKALAVRTENAMARPSSVTGGGRLLGSRRHDHLTRSRQAATPDSFEGLLEAAWSGIGPPSVSHVKTSVAPLVTGMRLRDAVRVQDHLALVPVTARAILDAYVATEIPAGTYPWQPNPVPTVAVTALLVAHDAGRRHCATIGLLAQHVVAGLGWLVKNGHPYWKRVDLARPVRGWEQYDCVRHRAAPGSPAASPRER